MKSRPILFSAPMVLAILEGRKTQTRRIVKPQPDIVANRGTLVAKYTPDDERLGRLGQAVLCPYGQSGDQLWVREAWYCDHWNVQKGPYLEVPGAKDLLYYRATDCDGSGSTYTGFSGETMCNPWRPSIHMPRWASRITLEIVSVRVERLQDIGYADALAEGVSDFRTLIEPECQQGETADECARRLCWPQRSYRQLWEQINGAGSWAANPWIWAIEFKRIEN